VNQVCLLQQQVLLLQVGAAGQAKLQAQSCWRLQRGLLLLLLGACTVLLTMLLLPMTVMASAPGHTGCWQ
jgi:hypothetical protein